MIKSLPVGVRKGCEVRTLRSCIDRVLGRG